MAAAEWKEEIEGLQEGRSLEDVSAYPLDDIMVRSENRTVGDIVKRIEAGRYAMNPDFQRDFVWRTDKQSKLIESCIMRIPLPVLYVAEGDDGRITVVDGLQRLSTFASFLSNNLKLSGLGKDHPLEGKRFIDLPINLQERIEDTQLTLYILDKSAPEAARLDIFDRVNSGIPLSRQQMRNALYNGPATRWLTDQAKSESFLSATGGSLAQETMRDREAINRFVAFSILGWETYTGDMDLFLANALGALNRSSESQRDALANAFESSMSINEFLFGRHAFRKSLVEGQVDTYRSVINISMFDTFSVFMAKLDSGAAAASADALRQRIYHLMRTVEFTDAITLSTNSTRQVRTRFGMTAEALLEWM